MCKNTNTYVTYQIVDLSSPPWLSRYLPLAVSLAPCDVSRNDVTEISYQNNVWYMPGYGVYKSAKCKVIFPAILEKKTRATRATSQDSDLAEI